jgi:putative hydrolase of the HAD superfamily
VRPTKASIRLNAVLFDLYGTTVDIEVDEDSPRLWHGLAAALSETGVAVEPSDVRWRFQTFLRDEAEHGREGFLMEPVFRRLLASLNAMEDVGRIGRLFRELSLKEMRLRPYVEPLFERLHRSGVKLGIVSNTEAVLTRFELDRYAILETVHTIVLSSEVGVKKPDPEIFRLALDRIGSTAVTTAFIGNDWTTDVLGAQRVGLKAIYLNDQVTEGVRAAAALPEILEVAPTLEAIGSALRLYGWQEADA